MRECNKDPIQNHDQRRQDEGQDVNNTCAKVSHFLQQNKTLKQSTLKINKLAKELQIKKDNLTTLIASLNKNLQEKETPWNEAYQSTIDILTYKYHSSIGAVKHNFF